MEEIEIFEGKQAENLFDKFDIDIETDIETENLQVWVELVHSQETCYLQIGRSTTPEHLITNVDVDYQKGKEVVAG